MKFSSTKLYQHIALLLVMIINQPLLSAKESTKDIKRLSDTDFPYTAMPSLKNIEMKEIFSSEFIPKELEQRILLARDPILSPTVLEYLAFDDHKMVRRAVAVNPRTPLNTLLLLASDNELSVRGLLAHCSRSPQVLRLLAKDKILAIRQTVVSNLYADEQTLMLLSRDSNPIIRNRISQHKNASFELVSMISLAD